MPAFPARGLAEGQTLQNRSLKSRQQRFKTDPDFVEVVARQSKRIRPNEILFVFEDPAPSIQ